MDPDVWAVVGAVVAVVTLIVMLVGTPIRRRVAVQVHPLSFYGRDQDGSVVQHRDVVVRVDVGRRPVVVESIGLRPVGSEPDEWTLRVSPTTGVRVEGTEPVPTVPFTLEANSVRRFRLGAVTITPELAGGRSRLRLRAVVKLSHWSRGRDWVPRWVAERAVRRSAPFTVDVDVETTL